MESMVIGVRNSSEGYNKPYFYTSDQRLEDYFALAHNITIPELVRQIEGYMTSGVKGKFFRALMSSVSISVFA